VRRIAAGLYIGQVNGRNAVHADELKSSLEYVFGHHFVLAVGTGIDVAVAAGLVAEFSEVEL